MLAPAPAGIPGPDLVPALARSPWWRRGQLIRLEPDAPAAAFLDGALFGPDFPRGRDALPGWLFIALQENAATLGSRLGRVMYDLYRMREAEAPGEHPLEGRLNDMLANDPARATPFAAVAAREVPVWAAGFSATVAILLARASASAKARRGI